MKERVLKIYQFDEQLGRHMELWVEAAARSVDRLVGWSANKRHLRNARSQVFEKEMYHT